MKPRGLHWKWESTLPHVVILGQSCQGDLDNASGHLGQDTAQATTTHAYALPCLGMLSEHPGASVPPSGLLIRRCRPGFICG
jgi:hypothetical protein